MKKKGLRALEFVILFFGIPLLIFLDEEFIHPSIIILPVLVFIFFILRRTTDFRWRELVRWNIPNRILARNGIIVLIGLALMLGYMLLFDREHLFDLPRSRPLIYLAMCIFYPAFSAFGQEIIYRTFLFRRYENMFGPQWLTILFSGLSFSFLHIVYYDPVSMILTFMGGIWFARVYQQTRSVLFTSVLHGAMGILIFGVGLGRYFWLDMPV
ncbi:MAG: CPBP family intramembrane metalloprotease [Bacteroidetes bacterium]|nr:CPBP family intramembrane metalloprotease [Bacteroidota bacterium]